MASSYPYADIFKRLLEGRISPEEAEALIEWLARDEQDPEAKAMVMAQLKRVVADGQVSDDLRKRMEAKLPAILGREEPVRPSLLTWIRYSSAAAVLLLVGAGILFLSRRHPSIAPAVVRTAPVQSDIAPGKQGAILTLADGRTVVLDSLGNGVIATQSGSKAVLRNGQLAYTNDGGASAEVAYNTMTTPKGRQFQLSLPDGTKVWLNAASSLRYPTAFTGKERTVEVTGEAYFEVAHDEAAGASRPFRVRVNGRLDVEVLGTHFNINAYTDEATINTTLLQGAVRVVNGGEHVVLKPGQQAQGGGFSPLNVIANANIDKVMAWKNGKFDFQDASLEEVMRQLQRWYDIDVRYEKGIPKLEFLGKMDRDLSLSEVLNGLQASKVHFRLDNGRTVIVMP